MFQKVNYLRTFALVNNRSTRIVGLCLFAVSVAVGSTKIFFYYRKGDRKVILRNTLNANIEK
jgi:hypothetical protein